MGVGQPSVNGPPLPTFIAGNDQDFNERANDSDVDENKLVMTQSVGVQDSNRNDLTSSKRGFPGSPRQDFQVSEDGQDHEMCSTMVKNQQEEEKVGLQKEKKASLITNKAIK